MSVVPSRAVFSSPKASEAADHGHDMHEHLGEIHFRTLQSSAMHSFESATNMVMRVMKMAMNQYTKGHYAGHLSFALW